MATDGTHRPETGLPQRTGLPQDGLPHPRWKMVMLQRKTELKDAIDKSDFTTFTHRTTTAQKPPRATLLMSGGDQSDLDDLRDITEGAAKVNETEMNNYQDYVLNMNNDPDIKNAPQSDKITKIREKLKDRNGLTKNNINYQLDKATDDAIDKISDMPETMQDSAADAFVDSMDIVSGVFNIVVGVLDNVLGNVDDIRDGTFTTVKDGVKTVVNNVTPAVKSIDDIFGRL